MPAKKAKKAVSKNSGGSQSSAKQQTKSSTPKSGSSVKKRSSTKRSASGIGASLKKAGQTVAEIVTDAVDTVAKATGLNSKKK